MLILSCAMYMIAYLFYSARTQDDLESRCYHEMKFVRIAFGLQHSYVLPLFLVLMFSIIVLTSVNINSCWTYVEQWLGMAAWQATGASWPHDACSLAPALPLNLTPPHIDTHRDHMRLHHGIFLHARCRERTRCHSLVAARLLLVSEGGGSRDGGAGRDHPAARSERGE